jgi:elongation factor G
MAIEPVSIVDREKLEESLEKVQREDPTFHWRLDKDTGQILIAGMGELHLENVRDRILREFKVQANVGAPRVSYRQTIFKASEGSGLFSKQVGQRNQYAKVSLRLEPTPETSKPSVSSQLSKDVVPLEFHPVIEEAAKASVEGGGVLGFALMQMRVILMSAEFHPGESTPAAYSAATAEAFEEALQKAGTVILEPVMRFEIQVPEEYYGTVSTDLNQRRASIQDVDLENELRVLRGLVPLSEVFGYPNTLRSLSQGRGTISLEPESYRPVPEEVAERFRL